MSKPGKQAKDARIAMTVRIDLPSFAAVVAFLESTGNVPKTRSDGVNASIKLLAQILEKNEKTTIPEFDKAVHFLSSRGLGASPDTPAARRINIELGKLEVEKDTDKIDFQAAIEEYKKRMRQPDPPVDKKQELMDLGNAPVIKKDAED